MNIGSAVVCNDEHLDVPVGMIGIVFDDYATGLQIIWENGEYCGYSHEEAERFFDDPEILTNFQYDFSNVFLLSRDFEQGAFTEAFNEAKQHVEIQSPE